VHEVYADAMEFDPNGPPSSLLSLTDSLSLSLSLSSVLGVEALYQSAQSKILFDDSPEVKEAQLLLLTQALPLVRNRDEVRDRLATIPLLSSHLLSAPLSALCEGFQSVEPQDFYRGTDGS
jgi:hypothetical protein